MIIGVLVAAGVVVLVAVTMLAIRRRRHRDLGTSADRTTFDTLHTASLATPGLREGLTEHGAQRAVRHLRSLLGTAAVALTDRSRTLAVDDVSHHHAQHAIDQAQAVLRTGVTAVLGSAVVSCGSADCRCVPPWPARSSTATPSWARSSPTVAGRRRCSCVPSTRWRAGCPDRSSSPRPTGSAPG